MTRRALTIPALTFALALAVLTQVNRDPAALSEAATVVTPPVLPGASTDERVRSLQIAVRNAPAGKRPLAQLGLAYLQKAQETGDPAYYAPAERVLVRATHRDRRDADAAVGLGTLALARHDFARALRLARRARRLQPHSVAPFPVLVDALLELGRYEAAGRALQLFVDRRPGLTSYARVSYFRELHGDLDGAVRAIRLAASAGGSPESVAFVHSLLGHLELTRGRRSQARRAYLEALRVLPGHAPAQEGLADADVAAGRLNAAIRRLRSLVDRLPTPDHALALGEAELAAGRRRQARAHFELVRIQQQLLAGNGVNTDGEFAVFEADHGSVTRAVRLARRAWANAPSLHSADALAWALTRAGRPEAALPYARRAIASGWREPLVLYHAGITARDAGRPHLARRLLRRSLSANPRFSALHAPRAARALEALR